MTDKSEDNNRMPDAEVPADAPLIVTVKVASQNMADLAVVCQPQWKVEDLKIHLHLNHPLHPVVKDQRIIYCGHLLLDDTELSTQIRHSESNKVVHLVCSASKVPSESPSASTSSGSSEQTSEQQQPLLNTSTDGLRQRNVGIDSNAGFDQFHEMLYMQYMNYVASLSNLNVQQNFTNNANMDVNYAEILATAHQQFMEAMGVQASAPGEAAASPPPPADHQLQEETQPPMEQENVPPPPADNPPDAMGAGAGGAIQFDDDGQPQDWLDLVYIFARVAILFFCVYIYSSLYRFILIGALIVLISLYNIGWFTPRRYDGVIEIRPYRPRRNRQEEERTPTPQPEAEDEEGRELLDIMDQEDGNNNIPHNNNNDHLQPVAQEAVVNREEAAAPPRPAPPPRREAPQAPPPPPPTPSLLAISWTFFSTFFTSLLPDLQEHM